MVTPLHEWDWEKSDRYIEAVCFVSSVSRQMGFSYCRITGQRNFNLIMIGGIAYTTCC